MAEVKKALPERRHADGQVGELAIQVGRLESAVEATNASVAHLSQTMDTMMRNQAHAGKTNWATMAAWAGILLIAIGGMFAYINQPIRSIQTKLDWSYENFLGHVQDGHPDSVVKIAERNKEHIAEIDKVLQREMRLLDSQVKERMDGMDRFFGKELQLLAESRTERQEQRQEFRGKVDAWILEHALDTGVHRGEYAARVSELERVKNKYEAEIKENTAGHSSMGERLLNLEREVFTGARYRAGRPSITP